MAWDFVDLFEYLGDVGIQDTILPFLLVFAIIFAVLEKTMIFGTYKDGGTTYTKKNINMLVAAVIGLMVVVPHVMHAYPPGQDIVNIMNSSLPTMAAIFIAVVLALVLMNLTTEKEDDHSFLNKNIAVYGSLAVVIIVFGGYAGWWEPFWDNWIGSETMSIVVMILVLGLVFYIISKDSPGVKQSE